MFFVCFIMCILFSPSGECFSTNIDPALVIEFHISGRLTVNSGLAVTFVTLVTLILF